MCGPRRREVLAFSHHRDIAALLPDGPKIKLLVAEKLQRLWILRRN
jgi:hypothetical protein